MKVTRVLDGEKPLFVGEFELKRDGSSQFDIGGQPFVAHIFRLIGEPKEGAHLHPIGVVSFDEVPGRKFWYLRRAEGGTNVQMWFLELPQAVASS